MELTALKKLTVITEALLRERILADLKSLGVKGYSIARVEGEGMRHLHTSDFEGDNIQLDTIVTEEVAQAALETLNRKYFSDFSIIVYLQDVKVLRSERF